MISSIWPMPQNLKVSKNESSNAVKNTQSTQDSSITNDTDFENFITSKQKFIVESNLDPKIKNDLKVALDDLAQFINQNQLKGGHVQIGFAVDSLENMSELAVIQQGFQEQFIDQSQQQLNYNPKGQIPFPKDHAIGFIVGTFDNDEPF
jgi:hypothetical protein